MVVVRDLAKVDAASTRLEALGYEPLGAYVTPTTRLFARTADGLFGPAERERSFFPVPAFRPADVRSTRVHFHVDAPNAVVLQDIARQIYAGRKDAQGQLKIHPIEALRLGPQVASLPGVYGRMPNFHAIAGAVDEAFLTGRLGDGDPDLLHVALTTALRIPGAMVELEEYLGEWTLHGDETVSGREFSALGLNREPFRAFDRFLCPEIPPLELHLAFDLPKRPGEPPPIPLDDLAEALEQLAQADFANGGWFLFKHSDHWAYRANEFSFASPEAALARLRQQAQALQWLLPNWAINSPDRAIAFSLEIVHGIWVNR